MSSTYKCPLVINMATQSVFKKEKMKRTHGRWELKVQAATSVIQNNKNNKE